MGGLHVDMIFENESFETCAENWDHSI